MVTNVDICICERLRVLGSSEARLNILASLIKAQKPMSVSCVVDATHYLQPRVSRHIQALRRAGLVRKEGGKYRAESKPVEEIFAEALEYVGGGHDASPT